MRASYIATALLPLLGSAGYRVAALPQPVPQAPSQSSPPAISGSSSSSAASSGSSSSGSVSIPNGESTVSTSISTAIPSPTVAVTSPLGSYAPPEEQSWCAGVAGSRIYCPGEILQTVQLAELYADSKTFVDKPTTASEDEVVNAFYSNVKGNNTVEALVNWIDTYFAGEGLDVLPAEIPNFNEEPGFLGYVDNQYIRGWIKQVHGKHKRIPFLAVRPADEHNNKGYWRDLVRVNVVDESCPDCVSSQIPLNRSFVVPGGRFRENCELPCVATFLFSS
jgi:alpha,alpha-trehalase